MENPEKNEAQDSEDIETDWIRIAGEPITIVQLSEEIYATGSEIACLRLAYRFAKNHIRVYKAKNGQGWYFVKYKEPSQKKVGK